MPSRSKIVGVSDISNAKFWIGCVPLFVFMSIKMATNPWVILMLNANRFCQLYCLQKRYSIKAAKWSYAYGSYCLIRVIFAFQNDNVDNLIGFNMVSYRSCKNLWKSCVEHHTFFRLHAPKPAPKKTFFPWGSKFRYRCVVWLCLKLLGEGSEHVHV